VGIKLQKRSDDALLFIITDVRRRNNKLWMEIVKLAMKKAPEEAKALLKGIVKNDALITKLMLEMVGE